MASMAMIAIAPPSVARRYAVLTMSFPLCLRQHIRAAGSDHGLKSGGDVIVIRLWRVHETNAAVQFTHFASKSAVALPGAPWLASDGVDVTEPTTTKTGKPP
jgi:hypothetical protein